jgi:hypothetical protein
MTLFILTAQRREGELEGASIGVHCHALFMKPGASRRRCLISSSENSAAKEAARGHRIERHFLTR